MIIEEQIRPFESIESAYEFVALLEESVEDALREVGEHVNGAEPDEDALRAEALRLAHYKLGQLSAHMHKSRRLLNDLRTIRRLLFRERADGLESEASA